MSIKPAFDIVLRALHWSLAGAITAMVATSQLAELFEHSPTEDTVWTVHVYTGYALTGILVLRLLWGVVGPTSARWSDFWHPAEWQAMWRERRFPAPRHTAGHDPLASLAFIAMYIAFFGMVATGLPLAASEFGLGPLAAGIPHESLGHWVKEIHEFGFSVILGLVGLHLAALVWHRLRGEDAAGAMLGRRR